MHKKTIMFFSFFVLLNGCSIGTNANNGAGLIASQSTPITINSAGIIPVFNRMPTTTKIQVHNNSNISISGIHYTVNNSSHNYSSINKSKSLIVTDYDPYSFSIDQVSASNCSTIVAEGSCDIVFTTPTIDELSDSGYALLTATYYINNEKHSFDQIINYKLITDKQSGVNVSSGLSINSFGNSNGYGTIYAYVNDANNSTYNIDQLVLDNQSLEVVDNGIIQKSLSNNVVEPIEIKSSSYIDNIHNNLSLISYKQNDIQKYQVSVDLALSPISGGAILVSGSTAVIDSAQATATGSLVITNVGNESATLSTATTTITGTPNLAGCVSGTVLGIGQSCTLTFKVPQVSGSGTITVPYSSPNSGSSSVISAITWTNSSQSALLSVTSTPNPVIISESSVTSSSSFTALITNVGGYSVTFPSSNSVKVSTLSGGAIIDNSSPSGCNNVTLNINQSCTVVVTLHSSTIESNKYISAKLNATYTGESGSSSYNRQVLFNYSTIP